MNYSDLDFNTPKVDRLEQINKEYRQLFMHANKIDSKHYFNHYNHFLLNHLHIIKNYHSHRVPKHIKQSEHVMKVNQHKLIRKVDNKEEKNVELFN